MDKKALRRRLSRDRQARQVGGMNPKTFDAVAKCADRWCRRTFANRRRALPPNADLISALAFHNQNAEVAYRTQRKRERHSNTLDKKYLVNGSSASLSTLQELETLERALGRARRGSSRPMPIPLSLFGEAKEMEEVGLPLGNHPRGDLSRDAPNKSEEDTARKEEIGLEAEQQADNVSVLSEGSIKVEKEQVTPQPSKHSVTRLEIRYTPNPVTKGALTQRKIEQVTQRKMGGPADNSVGAVKETKTNMENSEKNACRAVRLCQERLREFRESVSKYTIEKRELTKLQKRARIVAKQVDGMPDEDRHRMHSLQERCDTYERTRNKRVSAIQRIQKVVGSLLRVDLQHGQA